MPLNVYGLARDPRLHAALLFALNLAIAAPWLGVEHLDRMGSIEGAFIAVARWIPVIGRD